MLGSLQRRPRVQALSALLRGRREAPSPVADPATLDPTAKSFDEHFHEAADHVFEFLQSGGLTLEGMEVADIGCGDGIIDLALTLRGRPRRLVGYDVNPTRVDVLLEQAGRYEGIEALPKNLSFEVSDPVRIAAADGSYDVVVTWSAFEHVGAPEQPCGRCGGSPADRRAVPATVALLSLLARLAPVGLVPRAIPPPAPGRRRDQRGDAR